MAARTVLKLTGYLLLIGGITVILFPLFWVNGASHPPGIEIQLFSLFTGVFLGGWITGIGAVLIWKNNKYLTYGLVTSGAGFVIMILMVGTLFITKHYQ